mmetsp:Transcript_51722/g.139420  ORF Transcript_51722/g.139420 Transcript_51722/m.139420 type:complete len:238 (-) Transcript_51722:93-806(-)
MILCGSPRRPFSSTASAACRLPSRCSAAPHSSWRRKLVSTRSARSGPPPALSWITDASLANSSGPGASAAAAAAGPTLGGPDLDRPEWRAASHKERERALQKRSGPADRLRRMVLAQRADSLGEEEQRLLLQLRETLFERRSNMARMFRSVDLNNDGAVTLEEFLHALEGSGVATGHELDRAHNFVTEEEAARMMAFFDRDGQGLLRYNEFIRLLQGNLERPPPGGWRPSRQAFAET